MDLNKKEVLIVGGGFAGLAAGVELSSRGHHVTLIERRGHLGGRAYSHRDPLTGSTIDNGQHILMGCYHATLAFLDKIGTRDKVVFQRNLSVDFGRPGGRPVRFRSQFLPSPLHLLGGFLFFRGLSWRDKISLLGMTRGLKRTNGDEGSVNLDQKSITDWLSGLGHTKRFHERFWDPLALAALNDRPELSSAALFQTVLREALFSGRKGGRIGLPSVGLSDLYTDAARDYIERKGGQVLLKAPVIRLHFREREFSDAELEGGRRISAEALLVTAPFTALRKILPEAFLYEDPFFSSLSRLSVSPIVSINLWLDREITKLPFLGLWDTRVHWVFNKKEYLALVISGARDELKVPGPELIEMAKRELLSVLPSMAHANVVRAVVTKEPEATLAPAVGASRFRLPQKTPYRNLFFAGDWTDTGLPATIESAVRSANKAVDLIEQAG